jgi:hypothetical protein
LKSPASQVPVVTLNLRLTSVILSGSMVAFRSVERVPNDIVSRRYK